MSFSDFIFNKKQINYFLSKPMKSGCKLQKNCSTFVASEDSYQKNHQQSIVWDDKKRFFLSSLIFKIN